MLGTLSYLITAKTEPLKNKLSEAKEAMGSTDKTMKTAGKNIATSSEKMSKSAGDALAPMEQGLSAINPAAGQAVQGMKSMTMGAKALNMALGPIGLAVGAIATAIAALTAYFRGSVEGQERMAKIMGYLSGVMDAFKDVLIDLGGWLVKIFDDPKAAIQDLYGILQKYLIMPFKAMLDMIAAGWEVIINGAAGVGLAIRGIFDENARKASRLAFEEMRQGMEDFVDAAHRAASPVTDLIKGVKELGKEIASKAKETGDLAAREMALRMRQADDLVRIAELDAKIAENRRIANDEATAGLEAIKAQENAMELVEQKFEIQAAQAKEALAIQQERMALGHDTIEDVEQERRLQADLVRLAQARDNEMRNLLRRHGTLINQIGAEKKAVQDAIENERVARQKAIDEQIAAKESILEKIREADMTEVELAQERMEKMLAAHEWSEEERFKIVEHWENKIADLRMKTAEEAIEATNTIAETMKEAADGTIKSYALMAASGGASIRDLLSQTFRLVVGQLIQSIITKMPFPLNLALAAGAGTMAGALWNQIPGMADGGVVPPGYPNDTYLARLTSGETIIPASKGSQGGAMSDTRFVIEDDVLVGSHSRFHQRRKKFG